MRGARVLRLCRICQSLALAVTGKWCSLETKFSRKATDLVREFLVHCDHSVYPLQPGFSMSKALPVATRSIKTWFVSLREGAKMWENVASVP